MLSAGCSYLGYTTRPGLPSGWRTVYIKPLINRIDITQLATNDQRFPIYRHRLEADLTNAVIDRFQFTGLLRPSSLSEADCRLEGELVGFTRDALRYNASQQVEEWRLNIALDMKFYDQRANTVVWQDRIIGDTTYFALGTTAESEATALDRAITDVARRVVERSVENW